MKNQYGLFTRWYQELAGFNFTVINMKGKENSNADAISRSSHMLEAPLLSLDEYAAFPEIQKPVIQCEGAVNEMQYIQCSMIKIAEEQTEDKVWSSVISWVEPGHVPEKTDTRGKAREVLVVGSMFNPEVFKMKDRVLMFTKAANRN